MLAGDYPAVLSDCAYHVLFSLTRFPLDTLRSMPDGFLPCFGLDRRLHRIVERDVGAICSSRCMSARHISWSAGVFSRLSWLVGLLPAHPVLVGLDIGLVLGLSPLTDRELREIWGSRWVFARRFFSGAHWFPWFPLFSPQSALVSGWGR